MLTVIVKVGFVVCFIAWAVALWSLMSMTSFGRRAAQHLPRATQRYYLGQLTMNPSAPWVEQLLDGQGINEHRVAGQHARRAHMAIAVFFLVGLALLGLSLLVKLATH